MTVRSATATLAVALVAVCFAWAIAVTEPSDHHDLTRPLNRQEVASWK